MLEEKQREIVHQDLDYRIDFDEVNHIYYVDGVQKPSVSEIMKPLYTDYYANIDAPTLEKARSRGVWVHRAVELYETMGMEAPTEIADYLLSYKMAKKVEGFQVYKNEHMMTNGEFCGTIDILAFTDRNTMVIIDVKATSKINKDLLEVQLAGYLELALANGHEIEKVYVLHLKKEGYKFQEIIPNTILWQELKRQYHESH